MKNTSIKNESLTNQPYFNLPGTTAFMLHQRSSVLRRNMSLFIVGLLFVLPTGGFAAEPVLTITNLQPVSAIVDIAGEYDPGDPAVRVLLEKVHNPHLLGQNVRLNVDFSLKNKEPDYIHLSSINVWYPGSPSGPIDLVGDETLAIPEDNFTIPLKNGGAPLPLKQRPAMTNGGFGVTGLVLERKLFDGE